ncbi:MAG: hypothetical protein ACK56I_20330, partial [bacterium]
ALYLNPTSPLLQRQRLHQRRHRRRARRRHLLFLALLFLALIAWAVEEEADFPGGFHRLLLGNLNEA